MSSYVFTSSDKFRLGDFTSLVSFDEKYEDWFEVVLADENEFVILLSLLGLDKYDEVNLEDSGGFLKLYDYSRGVLPEYDENQFDEFYQKWLNKTGRESNMDEYGQLIFIRGHAEKWNKNANRIILQTKP